MKTKTHLIGIDASFKTAGIAIYNPASKSLVLHSGDFFSCIAFLNKCGVLGQCIAVLESPNLNSTIYTAWDMFRRHLGSKDHGLLNSEFSKWMMYAQRVGKSKAAGEMFFEVFDRQGIPVVEIAPSARDRADKVAKFVNVERLRMPTKTNAAQFQALTGYPKRCSEHARDAATLVHGRSITWAEAQARIQEARRQQ